MRFHFTLKQWVIESKEICYKQDTIKGKLIHRNRWKLFQGLDLLYIDTPMQ